MGTIIDHMLDLENGVDLEYLYIFRIKLDNKYLYSIGGTKEEPYHKLQEMLLELYHLNGYFPQARIRHRLCKNSVNKSELIAEHIAEHIHDIFGDNNEFRLYDLPTKKLMHFVNKYVPDVKDLVLESKMPMWSYSQQELEDINKSSIEQDDNYYIVRTFLNIKKEL